LIALISEDEFVARAQQIPLQKLQWDLAKQKGVEVLVRRDDLIDTHLSGNKFYKLFYNLHAAQKLGHTQLLSFGGAYSNHIYALAAAAKLYGFKSIGVIRGERPSQLSPTLLDAEAWGMQLHFVSRADYREKNAQELLGILNVRYGDFFEIPEGGANSYGVMGAKVLGAAIWQQVKSDYTAVCVACGTANTLAGLAAGLAQDESSKHLAGRALGFSVLKGEGDLGAQVIHHQKAIDCETSNWRLMSGFHGGGYAKKLPDYLRQFMCDFERETHLKLDPVYTLKMCWGVAQLLAQNYWPRGSRLILVHTGGLQGRRGFNLT
jgi:1-aminocyclopropane-1-carboxylate deaminase